MDGSALQSTLREMRGHLADLRVLGIMAIVGVLLGFAGPFGTFETLPLSARVAYWVATVFLTYIFGFGISMLVDGLWGSGRPLWLRVAMMILPAGLVATVLVALLNLAVFEPVSLNGAEILGLAGQCYAVATAVVVVSLLTEGREAASQPSPDAPPAILDRVAAQQRGGLIALIVEDHYVDIVTERGKTLVLMRLADAIRETSPVPGLQVHRSHWVARAAVVRAHRREGKVILELSNGMHLPVSRGYLQAPKDADLL